MLRVDFKAAENLASNIKSTDRAIDDALSNLALLTQSVIDVARKGFVGAHREIAILQRASDLQEVNFGCVGPGPITRPSALRVVSN